MFQEYFIIQNLKSFQMFFGLGSRDTGINCTTCWPLLQVGFKFFLILTLLSNFLLFFFPQSLEYIVIYMPFTIQQYRLWTIFTSFLYAGEMPNALLNILFLFLILYSCMPDLEKQFSTAYVFIEFFLQLFISNSVLIIIGYPLYHFQIMPAEMLIGFGLLPVFYSFLCQRVAKNPEELTRFCFFPCLIPLKFLPVIFLAISLVFNYKLFVPLMIYFSLAYYQHLIRKKSFIQLNISVYKKFDAIMPEVIKMNLGYVRVSAVEHVLREICRKKPCFSCCNEQQQESQFNQVQIIGGGVQIGGNSKNKNVNEMQKAVWLKKAEEMKQQQLKNEYQYKDLAQQVQSDNKQLQKSVVSEEQINKQ